MKEIVTATGDAPVIPVETKKLRGRPAGQFDYHKACVLRFLQLQGPDVYCGTNEDLARSLGGAAEKWRVDVSPRQIARYLRKLQEEKTSIGTPRIEISLHRVRGLDEKFTTVRRIQVNDLSTLS